MTNRIKQRIEELEMKIRPKSGITNYRVPGETVENAKTRFFDCHGRDMTDGI